MQKGRAFEQPLEMTIDRPNGHVVVRYTNDHGEAKVEDDSARLGKRLTARVKIGIKLAVGGDTDLARLESRQANQKQTRPRLAQA